MESLCEGATGSLEFDLGVLEPKPAQREPSRLRSPTIVAPYYCTVLLHRTIAPYRRAVTLGVDQPHEKASFLQLFRLFLTIIGMHRQRQCRAVPHGKPLRSNGPDI